MICCTLENEIMGVLLCGHHFIFLVICFTLAKEAVASWIAGQY